MAGRLFCDDSPEGGLVKNVMSFQTPTSEPTEIRAGETLQFTKTISDFPASAGWSINYSFRGGGTAIDFSSSASGDSHAVSVAASTTNGWTAGFYTGQGIAVNGTEKHQIYVGYLTVLTNLASASAGTDQRTHAKRTLDLIEATIEGRATDDILDTVIEGTQIKRLDVANLLMLRDRYRAEVKREELAAQVANGKATGRNIFVRFSGV